MIDRRFLEWLEESERILGAPEVSRAEIIARAAERRASLVRSLDLLPPDDLPPREIAERLVATERAIAELMARALDRTREELAGIRRAQVAVHGYRPTKVRGPSLLSRSI
jgi:hypothetical protein